MHPANKITQPLNLGVSFSQVENRTLQSTKNSKIMLNESEKVGLETAEVSIMTQVLSRLVIMEQTHIREIILCICLGAEMILPISQS